MTTASIQDLELSASGQRSRIHQTAAELRSKIGATRDKFTVANMARQHFVGVAVTVSALALSLGYRFGGVFAK